MSLVLQSSGGGSVTIAEPATASNYTATMPAATGTVMVSGNQPAFSAYSSANQSGISTGVFTKVAFNTEEFDTNSNYDNATNYRFTPTVAGYYQINTSVSIGYATLTAAVISIYKNGSRYKDGTFYAAVNANSLVASSLVYCNGSTDYIEVYVYLTGTTLSINGAANTSTTWFNGSMVRAA